jgi:hypothetical protein
MYNVRRAKPQMQPQGENQADMRLGLLHALLMATSSRWRNIRLIVQTPRPCRQPVNGEETACHSGPVIGTVLCYCSITD